MTARSLALSKAAAAPGAFGQHPSAARSGLTARHHGWSMLSAVRGAG